MQTENENFICAEIIKFEKPGVPVEKKRHRYKKDQKPVKTDDVTEIDPGNELDDVTAVDDAIDDVTAIDDEMTIVDSGDDDVTVVDE